MKRVIQAFAGVACTGVILLLALTAYIQYLLPDTFWIEQGEEFFVSERLSLTTSDQTDLAPKVFDKNGNIYRLHISISGQRNAQEVISYAQRRMVVPGGSPFGIKMFTDGVMVVGMSDIQMGSENVNPAKEAGLKIGDMITHMNGQRLERTADIKEIIARSEGKPVSVSVRRGENHLELSLKPVMSALDNGYKAGIWVRDSSAGIGTMTYYDPQTGAFAGLGHGVCDVDTGAIMPLSSGEIVDVNISGCNMGQSGKPGELRGTFSTDKPIGRLLVNSEFGLFGVMHISYFGADPIPMAYRSEIKPGPAVILSTISGNKPQSFDILIERVNYSDIAPTKNLVIKITDKTLLSSTGGIVQGMSGSPIIQDGKLVGAVTHVFVNDPTKGYGIFAENMDKQINNVESVRFSA
ncbi:MAG: SpoIVB peptidase [Oscillospiraceae bacterium]|jgi:stage IV sporulation protein B